MLHTETVAGPTLELLRKLEAYRGARTAGVGTSRLRFAVIEITVKRTYNRVGQRFFRQFIILLPTIQSCLS